MANPITRTAYYTLAVRAADAASAKPLCGDTFASRFMNDDARRVWEEFKGFTPANRSNAARHANVGMGTTFTDIVEDPERMILDAGYTMIDRASVTLDAVSRQTTWFPAFIVRWLMRTVREGYSIGVFRR